MAAAMPTWPTRFEDHNGVEETAVASDGRTLRVTVRDVTFSGIDFDALAPEPGTPAPLLDRFALNRGTLCSCTLRVLMPLPLMVAGARVEAELEATVALGDPAPHGGIDRESVHLRLRSPGLDLESRGLTGWFEDELLELQARLPPGDHLLACVACALSDYHPGGHRCFGDLACFRGARAAYEAVRTKRDLLRLWDARTEMVQETHLCPELRRRLPGAGYRG